LTFAELGLGSGMKTILGVVVGALVGAALTFAFFKANPPGAEELSTVEKRLSEATFDLTASKKAETRLRQQVAELKTSADRSNQALANAVAGAKPNPEEEKVETPEASSGNFSDVMEKFGKAQTDLAFRTLVERLGLEGAELEAFTGIFDSMRAKRQAAFGKFMTGGLTLEELALMEGYTPAIDDWVASNLDTDAQSAYSDYLETQEVNRVERKANEELTWLSASINLSPDQKDAAYAIFAEHQARERPQDFLDIDSMDTLDREWQGSMDSRYEALSDVLDESQLEVYQQQSALMGEMFKGFLKNNFEE
jgi:hypothetical protein